MDNPLSNHLVAVIGAGPAGLFATRELAAQGVHVVILNRDIKPGGLAEYGIYPDKLKMKDGLRNQFRPIVEMDNVHYYGNVVLGRGGDLTLDDLRALGVNAILVTAGAQGTKWLGLPGENLQGVYHAKDLVYHYNRLPPFSEKSFRIGRRVAVVGVGNVMTDIAHWLISEKKVDEVMAIARRGPGEVKFDRKEFELVVNNLDMNALDQELQRVSGIMRSIGQDPHALKSLVLTAIPRAVPTGSNTRFTLHFLASPVRILADERGCVAGLEVEDNTLAVVNEEVKARGLGQNRVIAADTIVFAIGDRVDENLGLPVRNGEYVKDPNPRFPQDGNSYEVCDPEHPDESGCLFEGIFVAGWARKASTGLVGIARKDGVNGARAVLQYLATLPPTPELALERVQYRLHGLPHPVVTRDDLNMLIAAEQVRARELDQPGFKFGDNAEMLKAMGL